MDRRSWLWRRKSSEKSPGETESSGSISSHSERFSDEQAYLNHNIQSPEVTSKATLSHEELDDNSMKSLTEKLAAALLNIREKEELVKQHAKVAEEAVSGWEKAENELFSLKQQLESITKKNSSSEDRLTHLDAALKECLRQLRQEREEREQKIHETIVKRTSEWESTKSELQNQLVELQTQLEAAKSDFVTSCHNDLRSKLEAAEKEISSLKLELFSRAEELELAIIERDLSAQAAETASKLHLESVKRASRLESECRRLKVVARKSSSFNEQRSVTASSVYVESFTDSQSDSGDRLLAVETDAHGMSELEKTEREPNLSGSLASALTPEPASFKNGKSMELNLMAPSLDNGLMDDFLEMERLAALPETRCASFIDSRVISSPVHGEDIALRAELEIMRTRTAEVEEKLVKMEAENNELKISSTEHQDLLRTLRDCLEEAEMKLLELQTELVMVNEVREAVEVELRSTNLKKAAVESRLEVVDDELKTMVARVSTLEEDIQKERLFSAETISKCQKLEVEISRIQHEAELQKAASHTGLKDKQDKELAVAASKFADCQKTIASLGQQLKALATLEDFLIEPAKPCLISKATTVT